MQTIHYERHPQARPIIWAIKDIQKAGWKSKSIFREHYKLPIKKNMGSHLLEQ